MASRIGQGEAKAAVDTLTARVNGGTVEIRTGTQPASVGAAATGTLLGTLTLNATAFSGATTANPAVATANAVTGDTSADASGQAGWYRAYRSAANGSTAAIDGAITVTGGGGEMQMANINIVAGGTIDITAWTVSLGTGA